jgi:hypothetical protein
MKVGEIHVVFDPVVWGGKDKDRNLHCYRRARIERLYTSRYNEQLADVTFLHDNRVSHGHFTQYFDAQPAYDRDPSVLAR